MCKRVCVCWQGMEWEGLTWCTILSVDTVGEYRPELVLKGHTKEGYVTWHETGLWQSLSRLFSQPDWQVWSVLEQQCAGTPAECIWWPGTLTYWITSSLDYITFTVCLVVCVYLPIIQTICLWDINAATKVNRKQCHTTTKHSGLIPGTVLGMRPRHF